MNNYIYNDVIIINFEKKKFSFFIWKTSYTWRYSANRIHTSTNMQYWAQVSLITVIIDAYNKHQILNTMPFRTKDSASKPFSDVVNQ